MQGPAAEPIDRSAGSTWARSPLLAIAGLAVASATVTAAIAHHGWFYYDDFWNLTVAHDLGWGWDFLGRPVFGHVTPGSNFLIGLVAGPGGFAYGWAMVQLVALAAAVPVVAAIAARSVGARPWPAVAAAAATAAAAPVAAASTWWSAGLNLYPSILGGMGMLIGVQAARRGARWGAALAALAFGLALSCSDGAIVFLVPVLALVVLEAGSGLQTRIRSVVALRRTWAFLAVPVVLLLIGRASSSGPLGSESHAPLVDLVTFPFVFLLKGFVPGLSGQVVGRAEVFGSAGAMVAIGIGVAAILLAVGARSMGSRLWVPIAVATLTVLARGVLVAWGRLRLLGWEDAVEARYVADLFWLVPVLVAGAWRPARSARPSRTDRIPLLLIGALCTVGLVGQLVTAAGAPAAQSRAYRDHLAATWAGTPGGTSVIDAPVPASVLGPQFGEFLFLSRTAGRGVPSLRYAPARSFVAADDVGRLGPVRLGPVSNLQIDQAFTAVGAPGVTHRDGCWIAGDQSALVWVPLTRPVLTGSWVLDLRLTGPSDHSTRFVAAGLAPSRYLVVSPQGRRAHRWVVASLPFQASQLGFELEPHARLCMGSGAVSEAVAR